MKNKLLQIITAVVLAFVLWASVSLSGSYYTSINVPVRLTDLPEGYAVAPSYYRQVNLKMKGEGWRLLMVSLNKTLEYSVSAKNDSGYRSVRLNQFVNENNWLTSSGFQVFDVWPEKLSFNVERLERKTVKIRPVISLTFKPHFGLVSALKLKPDSVEIYGPKGLLKKISFIRTTPEAIGELEGKQTADLRLEYIEGLNYSSRDCRVYLDVQRIVDKEFRGLDVAILNVPATREISLFPGKVNIVLRGGIETLGRLLDKDIHPYIDYQQVLADSLGSVEPVIKVPDYVTIIRKDPERLKYIIKKY